MEYVIRGLLLGLTIEAVLIVAWFRLVLHVYPGHGPGARIYNAKFGPVVLSWTGRGSRVSLYAGNRFGWHIR